jgi:hypothetical protein
MKKLLASILLLSLQANLFASGGFYCFNKNKTVEIYATTGRLFGNPISGETTFKNNGVTKKFKKDQVVGYWNMGSNLKLAVIDSDYNFEELTLEARKPYFSNSENKFVGKLELPGVQNSIFIICEME